MSPRFFLFLVVPLFGLLTVPVQADITKPKDGSGGAPVANPPKAVAVVRGQSVDIELTGTTSRTGDMSFRIRNRPKNGKLSEPVKKERLSAVVRYTPSPGMKADRDEFTFFVQMPGSSTSENATVTILITDAAPKLDAPPLVEAGRVVMGHPAKKEFIIRNTGNAPWTAKIPAPHGWRWIVPEGGNFRIEAGREVACEIVCEADTLTNLEESVPLLGDWAIRFVARIVPPFTVLPKQLSLKWNGDTRTREGSVELQNLDNRPLSIQVEGPEWLTLPDSLTLEADQKNVLAMSLSGKFDQTFTGAVKLTFGEYAQQVEVKAASAPVVLTFAAGLGDDGAVHFGKLTATTLPGARRSVIVRNEGGAAATLVVEAPEWFRLESPATLEGITLAPGAETTFVVLPPSDTAGTFWSKLTVTSGDSRASVILTAGIDPSAIPRTKGRVAEDELNKIIVRPASSLPLLTHDYLRKRTLLHGPGAFFGEGTEDEKMPRINIVDLEKDTGDSVTFSWDLPPGDGWSFQLYRATVQRLKTGGLAKVWAACGDEVQYRIDGRRASATVKELTPGAWFKCCLQTIGPDGRRSLPGKELGFLPSLPPPTHWQRYWEWYIAGAVGVIALCYWARKKWKQPISAMAT